MEMARSWQELGVVDTIYEDDHEEEKEDEEEEDCFNSPSLSSSATTRSLSCSPPLSLSSLPTSLKNAVQEWSRANGCTPDVIIRFQEQCFPLHRNHKGKLSEEEKNRLCYNVNCTKLSHHLFMHLVQNPRLPLRFVVQAMLVEQLHSHHSMLHRAVSSSAPPIPLKNTNPNNRSAIVPANEAAGDANITLGDILQRDAVLRQSAHIRTSMQATSFRIDSLERELSGLRRRLRCSEEALNATAAVDRASARSASFRIVRGWHWDGEDISDSRAGPGKGSTKDAKGFTAKLVHGLKSLFRRPGNGAPACGDNSLFGAGENGAVAEAPDVENKAVCQDEERRPGHRRNQSTA